MQLDIFIYVCIVKRSPQSDSLLFLILIVFLQHLWLTWPLESKKGV